MRLRPGWVNEDFAPPGVSMNFIRQFTREFSTFELTWPEQI